MHVVRVLEVHITQYETGPVYHVSLVSIQIIKGNPNATNVHLELSPLSMDAHLVLFAHLEALPLLLVLYLVSRVRVVLMRLLMDSPPV